MLYDTPSFSTKIEKSRAPVFSDFGRQAALYNYSRTFYETRRRIILLSQRLLYLFFHGALFLARLLPKHNERLISIRSKELQPRTINHKSQLPVTSSIVLSWSGYFRLFCSRVARVAFFFRQRLIVAACGCPKRLFARHFHIRAYRYRLNI